MVFFTWGSNYFLLSGVLLVEDIAKIYDVLMLILKWKKQCMF